MGNAYQTWGTHYATISFDFIAHAVSSVHTIHCTYVYST